MGAFCRCEQTKVGIQTFSLSIFAGPISSSEKTKSELDQRTDCGVRLGGYLRACTFVYVCTMQEIKPIRNGDTDVIARLISLSK